MSGFPGAGKSTVSKYIAKLTGAVIVDHDVLKSALLQSLEMKGIESTIVGGVSYDVEWVLIDSYLEQGHSVILIVHVYMKEWLKKELSCLINMV